MQLIQIVWLGPIRSKKSVPFDWFAICRRWFNSNGSHDLILILGGSARFWFWDPARAAGSETAKGGERICRVHVIAGCGRW